MEERTFAGSLRQSKPLTLATPESKFKSVQRMFMVVVLPAPLGPRKPKTSPSPTSKETPLTASFPL